MTEKCERCNVDVVAVSTREPDGSIARLCWKCYDKELKEPRQA
jgi:hypothetical protein